MQRYNKYFIFAIGEGYFLYNVLFFEKKHARACVYQKKVVPLHANLNNYV